jgi:hypothetical protein
VTSGPPWPRCIIRRIGLVSRRSERTCPHIAGDRWAVNFPTCSSGNHSRDRHGGRSTRPGWDGLRSMLCGAVVALVF